MHPALPLFVLFSAAAPLAVGATEKPALETPESAPARKSAVTREGTVTIAGKSIRYKSTAGKLPVLGDDGKPRASIFHVTYERTDVEHPENRPVLFAFNGGPGSSSVWLHLGALGPKRVDFPGNGTEAPMPPAQVVDNPMSILDQCDLVFIDPVSTGYSRPENDIKASEFHGLDEDVDSVGEFIRCWVTERKRWGSPKYLLGESYGGIRAAGLASRLQDRYGMSLNGVVLLSSLLDFATMDGDLGHMVYLPSYTGVAHYHHKISGDRDALVQRSADFAFGDYAKALLKGNALDGQTKAAVAAKLAEFTGIAPEVWIANRLRLDPSRFRAELLRREGKIIGRFDARVTQDALSPTAQTPDCDPSFNFVFGAFSTAMLDYLGSGLGYVEERPYDVMSNQMKGWRWNSDNGVVNVADRLSGAMRENPHLRVLVMAGYTDLATPPEGVAHALRQLDRLPAPELKNISIRHYDGGHMFYLNPPDLAKTRADLLEFIGAAAKEN